MSDILIRGISMPKSCLDCNFSGDYGDCCCKDTEPYECEFHKKSRQDWCPLTELPEHGRLIDADSLADDLLYDVELAERALDDTSFVGKEREYVQSEKDIKQNCAYYVSHAPVIVPSNKEDAK